MLRVTQMSLQFFCFLIAATAAVWSVQLYGEAEINELLENDLLEVTDKPGIFPVILHECQRRSITDLPWLTVLIKGSTLSDLQQTKSLASLMTRLARPWTFFTVQDIDDMGSVLADILNQLPVEVNLHNILITKYLLSSSTDVTFSVKAILPDAFCSDDGGEDCSDYQHIVKIDAVFPVGKLTDVISQFTDRLTLPAKVRTFEIELLNSSHITNPSVLDNLFRMNVEEVILWDTHPADVLSASLRGGRAVTWKSLHLAKVKGIEINQKDKRRVDQLRKYHVISDTCEVTYDFSPITWLPDEQRYDWSQFISSR